MKILFLGNTAVHTSLLAASIYLGQLPTGDFWQIKQFADLEQDRTAYPVQVGTDRNGIEVYTLGAGRELAMTKKSLEHLRDVLGCAPDDLIVETVSLKGDSLIMAFNWLPPGWGRNLIHGLIARLLYKPQLPKLVRQVEDFQISISELSHAAGG